LHPPIDRDREGEMANAIVDFPRPRCGCRLGRLLPDEFRRHRRAARRERILSWRSLLDAAVERLDEAPAGAGRTGVVPDAFWAHRQAAREEDLLAVRSLVDSFFGWVEAWLEEPPPTETVMRIEVE
jgi:hypothetical protein